MVKDKDNVLGERLTNLRERHDWSKTQVANKIGLSSMQKYANYEYGVRQPDFDTLVKLADLFEVTTDYLLGHKTDLGDTPVAAHYINDDIDEETQKEIDEYIEFKKAQYKKRMESKED